MTSNEQGWFDTLSGLIKTAILSKQQQAASRDHLQFERLLSNTEEELRQLQQLRSARLQQPTSAAFLPPKHLWRQVWLEGIANNLHNMAFLLHGELSARVAAQGKLLQAHAEVEALIEMAYLRIVDPTPLQMAAQPQDGMPVDEVRAILFGNLREIF